MRKRHTAVALAATSVLLVSGCAGSTTPDSGTDRAFTNDGTFTIAVDRDLGSLNPYKERQNFGFGLAAFMYDSLVHIDGDANVTPQLAESWETTPNSATFTLKEGITCSDGTELTATHVADVLNFNMDPTGGSSQYGLRTSVVPGVATGDDETREVSVELEDNDGLLLYAIGNLPIVCPTGLADPSIFATQSDGTGPYVLESVAAGDRWTMVKRDDYTWGPDGATTEEEGMPAEVVLRLVQDETTASNLLVSGELNLARVSGRDQARLDGQDLPYELVAAPASWLSINQRPDLLLADKGLREALVAAVDIDEVIKVSGQGDGSAPTSLLAIAPAVCAGTTEMREYLPEYDPDAAAAKLDELGWVADSSGMRSKDGQQLTIRVVYSATQFAMSRATVELIASKWEEIGVNVEATIAEGPAMTQLLYETSDFDIAIIGWSFGLPNGLVPYVSGPTPPNGTNSFFLENEEYEAKAAEAMNFTPPEACEYWQEAERALVEEVAMAPLSNRADRWYFSGGEGQMQVYFTPKPTSLRVYE